MKRRREMEESEMIRSAIEELSSVVVVVKKIKPASPSPDDHDHDADADAASASASASDAAHVPTRPFLSVCNLLLQVLDRIGPTMAVLRQDIHQNIQRLEKLHESDPKIYSNLVEMLKKEKIEGNARKGPSCCRAFVWLTRSMNFAVALIQRLTKDPGKNMEEAVEESYNITLKPWHGWISSAAFKVALKIVPDNKTFTTLLMSKDENYETLKEDLQTLISLLVPFLEEIHSILRLYGLDTMKSP